MNTKNPEVEINPFSFNLKNLVILLLVLIGIYLLLPQLVGVQKALGLIVKINKYYLILALLFEFISYVGAAWLLGIILSRLGHKLKFFTRFKLASIAAFTIHFLPIGTAGEAAFEYYFLKKAKVDSGSILLTWILRWIFNYSGFFIIFLVGLVLVPIHTQLSFSSKLAAFIISVIIVGLSFYLIYLYRHKEKFWQTWQKFFGFINRTISKFKKNPISTAKYTEIFEDIYTGLGLFGQKKRNTILAVISAMVYWIGDLTCLYFVFRSFGYSIHLGTLIFGYCSATLLGIISAIPGGIGLTEGTMTLIFSSTGIPAVLALTVVLVFRLFSFWIWIPIGFLSFLSLRKAKK